MTTATTDEVTHLRALLAEQTARADGLDQQLSAVLAGIKRNTKVMNGDNHLIAAAKAQQARAEKVEAERDAALAACAEMRAALEEVLDEVMETWATCEVLLIGRGNTVSSQCVDRLRAALSRPDLGAGMVVVPREMVERVTEVVGWYADNGRGTAHGIRKAAALLADLDALLKRGGG